MIRFDKQMVLQHAVTAALNAEAETDVDICFVWAEISQTWTKIAVAMNNSDVGRIDVIIETANEDEAVEDSQILDAEEG